MFKFGEFGQPCLTINQSHCQPSTELMDFLAYIVIFKSGTVRALAVED
jgi:hypothetical protein